MYLRHCVCVWSVSLYVSGLALCVFGSSACRTKGHTAYGKKGNLFVEGYEMT